MSPALHWLSLVFCALSAVGTLSLLARHGEHSSVTTVLVGAAWTVLMLLLAAFQIVLIATGQP